MKLLTNNLGRIIASIAAVALLISVVTVSASPIGTFFENVVDKETGIAQDMMDSFGQPFMGGGSGGALENTGVVPAGGVYTVKATGQVLNGGDPLPTPLSNGDVLEYKTVFYTLKKSDATYDSLEELYAAREAIKEQAVTEWGYSSWEECLVTEEFANEDEAWEFLGLTEDKVIPATWSARADYTVYRTANHAASAPVMSEVLGYSVVNNVATLDAVNGTVPSGAKYTVKATGQVLNAGDALPAACAYNDTITYGDYTYIYKTIAGGWSTDGWTASINTDVTDKNQESYGPILNEIIGEKVTSMRQTFSSCSKLKVAPTTPNNITDMRDTYSGCSALVDVSNINIPDTVSDMDATFSGCSSLVDISAINIPQNVTDLTNTFLRCSSIVDASVLELHSGITDMALTFAFCSSLEKAPAIPNSVTDMGQTFRETNLKAAPIIPASVSHCAGTFWDCKELTGTIVVNASANTYASFLKGTEKPIVLTGSSTVLDKLAATANNGNVTVQ